MPIYEYRCANCGTEKEVLRKVSDPPLVDCPSCGKAAMVKKVTAAGFQLKGTGWYVTDFKNANSTKSQPSDKKSDGAAENQADGKATEGAEGKVDGKAGKADGKGESGADANVSKTTDAKRPAADGAAKPDTSSA